VTAIVMNVGWAVPGDNLFRGFSVKDELAGRDGYWSLLSLAVGGPRLGPADAAFLDEVCGCMVAADPRIWPLKVAWIAGSYGSPIAAMCASQAYLEAAQVGGWTCGAAAEVWQSVAFVADAPDPEGAFRGWFAAARARGKVAGYGVPGRDEDERVLSVVRAVARHRRAEGRFYRLFEVASRALGAGSRVRPNLASVFGAVGLDLGLDPRQTGLVAHAALCIPLWANGVEAAGQAPAVLRALPVDAARYEGKPERSSPRAAGGEGRRG
jgi:hypothetical protein